MKASFAVLVLLTATFFFSQNVLGETSKDIPLIGTHFELFRFHKNVNPQNVLVAYAKLDSNCEFTEQDPKKIVDFYWSKNNGSAFKTPHSMLKSGIRKRLEPVPFKASARSQDMIAFKIKEKRIENVIKDVVISVDSRKTRGTCEVQTIAEIPGDKKSDRVLVENVRAETKRVIVPPFHKLVSLTIEGKSLLDGKTVSKVFAAD